MPLCRTALICIFAVDPPSQIGFVELDELGRSSQQHIVQKPGFHSTPSEGTFGHKVGKLPAFGHRYAFCKYG
jgi:hypothetical protein